jgi:hypothetical protein
VTGTWQRPAASGYTEACSHFQSLAIGS